MKCSLDINLSSDTWIDIVYDEFNDTYEISLNINPNDDLEEILKRENFDKILRDTLSGFDKDDEVYKYSIEGINKFLTTDFPVLDNSRISINLEEGIDEFINNNSCLQGKQLIVNGEYDINHGDLDPLIEMFKNHKDYLVSVDGNISYVTIEQYERTVLAIDDIVNKIKKYNLSSPEQIMYAYDLVRDRVYTSEGKDEDYSVSRDISSAILGDKIVCVGYSIIFEKVLDNLGIKSKPVTIKRKDNPRIGHRRNMIYVDDPKYDVYGIYYFDATWDSKKNNSESAYLDSYKFFCKAKREINKYDSINYTDETLEGLKDLPDRFEEILKTSGLTSVPKEMIKLINYVSNLIDGEDLINIFMVIDDDKIPEYLKYKYTNEELINKVRYYWSLLNSDSLGISRLTELLYNVRKIEYYEEPSKYPFSIEDFERTVVDEGIKDSKQRLLDAIFGDGDDDYMEFEEKANDMKKEKMIEQVKLAKALREAYESKKKK